MATSHSQHQPRAPVKQQRIRKEDYVYRVLILDPKSEEVKKMTIEGFEELFKLKLGSFSKVHSLTSKGTHKPTKSASLQTGLGVGVQKTFHLPDRSVAHVTRIK